MSCAHGRRECIESYGGGILGYRCASRLELTALVTCPACRQTFEAGLHSRRRYCGVKCRQAAYKARKAAQSGATTTDASAPASGAS